MSTVPFGTYDPALAQVNGSPALTTSPRLYLDLDGVMADFDAHFPATFGLDHRGMADDALWATINAHPSYFRDMPPCPGAVAFFRTIEHLDPIILTACPKSAYAHVARQKRAWVREHLSKDVVILPVMGGKSKPLFMHAPGDILIDDFARNTDAWTAEGGVAILHKTFAETSARLRTALGLGDCAVPDEPPAIEFTYQNWRGETSVRKARPSHLWYGATEWHPEPQWLLHALDCEKDAYRDFALVDMSFARHADAEQPAVGDSWLRVALMQARQFIANGIELGFIRMPDAATPDPAHGTLDLLDAALSTAVPAGVAMAAEDELDRLLAESEADMLGDDRSLALKASDAFSWLLRKGAMSVEDRAARRTAEGAA